MIKLLTIFLAVGMLAGCASHVDLGQDSRAPVAATAPGNVGQGSVTAATGVDAYKRVVALHISQVNGSRVFVGRPQALLRSVVVLRYTLDARGRLLRSEVMRSNHDRETETIALASLRNSAPFPQPASQLLRHGKLDIAETWLFNNDGRFQLRSIAEAQMDQ